MFEIGTRICVLNDMDGQPDYGTVILMEPDNELGVMWLYLKADEDVKNTNVDPKIKGLFWRIIDSNSDKLFLAN